LVEVISIPIFSLQRTRLVDTVHMHVAGTGRVRSVKKIRGYRDFSAFQGLAAVLFGAVVGVITLFIGAEAQNQAYRFRPHNRQPPAIPSARRTDCPATARA
jgi:hypothetical protein